MNRQNDLGTLIKAIENRKEMLEDRALRPYGISASQAHILLRLMDEEDHTLSLKQLERECQLSQTTIVKLIHRMSAERSLVEILPDQKDQRIRLVRLAKQGEELAEKISDIPERMEQILKGDMSSTEVEQFRSQLNEIRKRLEEADEKNIYRR